MTFYKPSKLGQTDRVFGYDQSSSVGLGLCMQDQKSVRARCSSYNCATLVNADTETDTDSQPLTGYTIRSASWAKNQVTKAHKLWVTTAILTTCRDFLRMPYSLWIRWSVSLSLLVQWGSALALEPISVYGFRPTFDVEFCIYVSQNWHKVTHKKDQLNDWREPGPWLHVTRDARQTRSVVVREVVVRD